MVEHDFEHRHDETGQGTGTGHQPFLVMTYVHASLGFESYRYCFGVVPSVASYTYLDSSPLHIQFPEIHGLASRCLPFYVPVY